jgi:hypothetical protein
VNVGVLVIARVLVIAGVVAVGEPVVGRGAVVVVGAAVVSSPGAAVSTPWPVAPLQATNTAASRHRNANGKHRGGQFLFLSSVF